MVWCTVTWVVSLGGGTFWPPSGTHWSSGTPSDTHWSAYFTPSPNLVTFLLIFLSHFGQWHPMASLFHAVTKPCYIFCFLLHFGHPMAHVDPHISRRHQTFLLLTAFPDNGAQMQVSWFIRGKLYLYNVQCIWMYTAMGTFEIISTCQLENENSGLLGWRQDISQFANLVWAFFWLLFVVVVFNSGGCGAC